MNSKCSTEEFNDKRNSEQPKEANEMKNKKKNMNRLLVIAISAIMAVSLMFTASITAFAAEDTDKATILSSDYSISDATAFVFSDSGITASEGAYSGYKIDGTSLTIKESGTYVVSGACANGTIVVKKNVTGVTLVLNGLTLSASATAPITCNKGSEVSIVAAAGTVNNLADDKYNNDDTYTDEALYPDIENAVIKCKDGSNVTICGTGTINITANGKNGIKGGYDLYEEDEEGNATDTLISTSSLTIKEVTLNITANVNDGLKSDKELIILSGNITVSAVDDGIKCDYVLNIGAEGTEGPTVNVKKAAEGIEAATLNVYSGTITVNATDDGINAANSDLSKYGFSYNQYGGTVYVNVTNGDGIDSNGTINLYGGTLEVYSPAQGDGDPLDSANGTYFKGATVLAVGHLGMAQGYSATTPCVSFGSAGGMGGFGGMGGQTNLVTSGNTIQITDASGNVLYTAKAVRNASYILFTSPKLTSGANYTLKNGTSTVTAATAGAASTGGMGMGGQMPGNMAGNQERMPGGNQGMMPGNNGSSEQVQQPENGNGQGQVPGMNGRQERPQGGRQNGVFPNQSSENNGEIPTPPEMDEGTFPEMPDNGIGEMPQFPNENSGFERPGFNFNGEMLSPPDMNGEMPEPPEGELPPQMQENEDSAAVPQIPGNSERPGHPGEENRTVQDSAKPVETSEVEETRTTNWFMNIINAILNFFRSLFGKG